MRGGQPHVKKYDKEYCLNQLLYFDIFSFLLISLFSLFPFLIPFYISIILFHFRTFSVLIHF